MALLDSRSAFKVTLFFGCVLGPVGIIGCSSRKEVTSASNEETQAQTGVNPVAVMSNINGKIVKIDGNQFQSFSFLSHNKILTWDGIINEWQSPNVASSVHIFDTKLFPGHLEYAQKGLSRGGGSLTQDLFFTEVQFPKSRRYMPFTLYTFTGSPLVVNNKTFKWAIQMRRYNFRDTDMEFAKVVERTKNLVRDAMGSGLGEPLIIAYSTPNSFRRPHINKLTEIHQLGMGTLKEEDFIAKAGGSLLNVLNPGVGFGFLKFVPPEKVDKEILTVKNIVIYQDSPERVPPVSGIVTLDPQTPLSHVNLLAKNRGTLNISTLSLAAIPNLESLIGKLVKLEGTKDGRVSVSEAPLAQAQAFWDSQRKPPLAVPEAVDEAGQLVTFASTPPEQLTVSHIGAKASNYAFIQRILGEKVVHPGHSIGFGLYKKIARDSGAQALVSALLKEKNNLSPEQISAKLAEIRTTIQTKTPAATLAEFVSQVRALQSRIAPVKKIRFRSSTNSEDLPGFNGAGLYESAGFKFSDTDDIMKEKLLLVMSSLWLDRAYFERDFFNLDHGKVAMAVQINPSFSDESANGVILAWKEPNRFSFHINSQLGEASVTNPEGGEVPESLAFLNEQVDKIKVTSTSNIGNVFLAPSGQPVGVDPTLKDTLVFLKKQSEILVDAFTAREEKSGDKNKYGIDIEFKLMLENGVKVPFIKQARLLLLNELGAKSAAPKGTKVTAKSNSVGGGHIRVAPEQLSALHPLDFCLVPSGQSLGIQNPVKVGSFTRVKIVDNPTSCFSFKDEVFLFTDHFQF